MTLDDALLDLSHFDQATFDPVCLYASGVRRVILGTTVASVTAAQIQGCRAAGIEVVGLYGLPYYGGGYYVTRDVNNAVALRGFEVPWFALDCETDAVDVDAFAGLGFGRPSVAQRRAETIQVRRIAEAAGYRCMIYTGEPFWTEALENTRVHADLPLWLANYGLNDPLRPRPPIHDVSFGGWTRTTIHQYSSTIVRCGRQRDHNYLVQPLPGEGDDMGMTPEEAQRLALLERIVAANGIDVIDANGVITRLTGDAALAYLDRLGTSAYLSLNRLNDVMTEIRANLQAHIASHQTAGDHSHAELERLIAAANAFADALD